MTCVMTFAMTFAIPVYLRHTLGVRHTLGDAFANPVVIPFVMTSAMPLPCLCHDLCHDLCDTRCTKMAPLEEYTRDDMGFCCIFFYKGAAVMPDSLTEGGPQAVGRGPTRVRYLSIHPSIYLSFINVCRYLCILVRVYYGYL